MPCDWQLLDCELVVKVQLTFWAQNIDAGEKSSSVTHTQSFIESKRSYVLGLQAPHLDSHRLQDGTKLRNKKVAWIRTGNEGFCRGAVNIPFQGRTSRSLKPPWYLWREWSRMEVPGTDSMQGTFFQLVNVVTAILWSCAVVLPLLTVL